MLRQRITQLAKNLAIYGLGDVATSIVSFLLLPIYVRYLSPEDYGIISLLLTIEAVSKIVFRWGVDASFMRLYYDCPDQAARQRLASTIFFFLMALNGAFLLVFLAAAPSLASHLFGVTGHETVLCLVLLNTFVVGFYFIPFHVIRIHERSWQFIALSFSRSIGTIILRLVAVVVMGLGVLGVVLADVVITVIFTIVLGRWFAPLIRPVFSLTVLREALSFGLPRLPHGISHQVIAVADRYILARFVPLAELGIYSIGASFGLALKLFLSAFEYSWAPFYFSIMKEPDAKHTYSLVTTYGVAVLVLLAAGLSAIAEDLVRLMTTPDFYSAARVIPWIALGVLFQGIYLLTSIGLNITKRTSYYPLATAIAAAVSVGANLLLIPRAGAEGAAWSNTLAYLTLAGVAMGFSQRFYPVQYEYRRLAASVIAGIIAYSAARFAVPSDLAPLIGLLARGGLVAVAYPLLLFVLGFYQPRELDVLIRLFRRAPRRQPQEAQPVEVVELASEIAAAPLAEDVTEPGDRHRHGSPV